MNTASRRVRLRMMVCLAVLSALCLAGCSKAPVASRDVLTQKPIQEGRTPITVMVKYAFSIGAFEKAVEEEFPDIDVVQVGNYTAAMSPDEMTARMRNDDLTDVVMTWPLDAGEEYWKDCLLDLSGMPFTSRYNASMLNTITREGKLYYLPGPAQVRGIVYNKTLFEEKGWVVPGDFEGFVALCRQIEQSGMRSIQLGFKDPEVLDTAFVGYGYADCFAKPKDAQWIVDYAEGKGAFYEHFEPALTTFQAMIDAGIWLAGDLNVDYSQREEMFFSRQCAMIEDSPLMTKSSFRQPGDEDELALMPFFNPGSAESDWARVYMVCYIGLNKHLTDKGNEDKYEKVLKLMDYISTPEGQEALAADTGAMYSSLKGVNPPDIPEIEKLVTTLERGRYAIFPKLKTVQDTLREGLAGMVAGTMDAREVARRVDETNAQGVVKQAPEVLGKAAASFTLAQTGGFVTDVMREETGTEVALYLDFGKDGRTNSKGVTARLYAGDVTESDLARILPNLQYGETGRLWKAAMRGSDLLTTLEYAIPTNNNQTGWFYYFSGLKMTFDPVAEPGSRVKEISMADGSKFDPDKVYTLAVMSNTVPQDFFISSEDTGKRVIDVVRDAIRSKKVIEPSSDGRFTLK